MNYTLTVYVGSIEYKKITLRASTAAVTALKTATPKAMSLFRRKVTELTDTYSWTHAEYTIDGVQNVINAW
jgi:hypothetical protein